MTKTTVTAMERDEDDGDWSEVSELQEIDPGQLQSYRDQNGNTEKRSFGKGETLFKMYICSKQYNNKQLHLWSY